MASNFKDTAGTDLDSIFAIDIDGVQSGAIGFKLSNGQDLGNRYTSYTKLNRNVGYKNSSGTDIGYLRGPANHPASYSLQIVANCDDAPGLIIKTVSGKELFNHQNTHNQYTISATVTIYYNDFPIKLQYNNHNTHKEGAFNSLYYVLNNKTVQIYNGRTRFDGNASLFFDLNENGSFKYLGYGGPLDGWTSIGNNPSLNITGGTKYW